MSRPAPPDTDAPRSALVLGGGLAGISAAVRLAEADIPVTLVETSRRLGGRATSHDDPATGQTLDNCQHVLLGCCTSLIDLYRRLGVDHLIRWDRDLHFFDKQGHHDVLRRSPLPAPFHLSPALLRFRSLTWGDKTAISRAMLAILRLGPAGRSAVENISFLDWLRDHRQPPSAIDRFWAVIITSALNATPAQASAAAAIQVFQDGFLADRDAYTMGTATVPLRRLYDPAVPLIESRGGSVRFGDSVRHIHSDGSRITAVELDSGEQLTADAYISALPFDRLAKVADDALRQSDDRLAGLDRFAHSPILGIHLWFDRPVTHHPHMIFVDSPLHWIFNKSAESDPSSTAEDSDDPSRAPQYLHGVISAADEYVSWSSQRIIDMAVEELARYAPAAADAELIRGRAIKEKRATFTIEPGIETHRPAPTGPTPNLFLCGDWTDTGWPATMEGAARSGDAAANAARQRRSHQHSTPSHA